MTWAHQVELCYQSPPAYADKSEGLLYRKTLCDTAALCDMEVFVGGVLRNCFWRFLVWGSERCVKNQKRVKTKGANVGTAWPQF